jgi:hypothetical protein
MYPLAANFMPPCWAGSTRSTTADAGSVKNLQFPRFCWVYRLVVKKGFPAAATNE